MEEKYSVKRFEKYIDMEKFFGEYFDFETTHSKCMACPGYSKTWACPEYDFDPGEFLKKFSRFHFIVDMIDNSNAADVYEAQSRLFFEKKRYDREMRELEKETPGSYALAAQECQECKKCARIFGLPCIHPDIMRYGLESLGGLPTKMVPEEFGFDILWSKDGSIPEYYLLVAGVFEP